MWLKPGAKREVPNWDDSMLFSPPWYLPPAGHGVAAAGVLAAGSWVPGIQVRGRAPSPCAVLSSVSWQRCLAFLSESLMLWL